MKWSISLAFVLFFGNILICQCHQPPQTSSLECRGTRWVKVYQHDRDGVAIFGSLSQLRDAVKEGAEVRVLRSDPLYEYWLTNIQNISPVPGTDDVCAQALMDISKDTLYTFADEAAWCFSNLCTTGDVHVSKWKVGEHTLVNETSEQYGLSWFIRFRCSAKPIFTTCTCWNRWGNWRLWNDYNSIPWNNYNNLPWDNFNSLPWNNYNSLWCNNYNSLQNRIRSGNCLRIVYRTTSEDCYSFPVDNVEIAVDDSVVGAMHIWHVSQTLVSGPDRYEFNDDAYWRFALHSSDGSRHISSWEVGDHVQVNEANDTLCMEWYSDPCWTLIYSHDENGNQLTGSRDDLVAALEAGHRVKLFYDDHTLIEGDEILIRNGHVCAQLINHLSKADITHFTSDVHWFWQICCTTGTCNVARIKVGNTETVSGTTPIRRSIKWFVDTREWEHVLSVAADGSIVSGGKATLAEAVRQGAVVRYRMDLNVLHPGQGYSLVYTADNLVIDPDTDDVIALHVRAMLRSPSGSYEEVFVFPLRWIFVLADTQGNVPVDFYKVGVHTRLSRGTYHYPIDWFVNR